MRACVAFRYPFPLVDVEKGKCYRLRLIMMASNVENYLFSVAGHNMTLVALDGVPVVPLQVTKVNMHIGERADVILCADQEPGYVRVYTQVAWDSVVVTLIVYVLAPSR